MSLNCGYQRFYHHPLDDMSMESYGGMILIGVNQKNWRKTCPSATSSTTNPTWTGPGTNPGLSIERQVTKHHDMALK
jgi:hypothetical protein